MSTRPIRFLYELLAFSRARFCTVLLAAMATGQDFIAPFFALSILKVSAALHL